MLRSPSALLAAVALLGTAACDLGSGPDRPGPPASLEVVSGDLQTAPAGTELPQPLVVEVSDAQGRPVRGQVVNWVVSGGGGSVFAGTALTDRDGRAQERWTLGTAAGDTQRVEARAVDPATGAAIVFAEFRAVASAGAAANVAPLDSASRTGAPGAPLDSLAVRVTDAFGNPVAGESVSFAASGGGSVSPATAATGPDGVARAEWTLGTNVATAQTATATAAGEQVVFTAQLTMAGTLAITGGNGQTAKAGSVLQDSLEVRFTTAGGAPIQGATIEWFASVAGSATPPTSVTGSDGYARTSWRLDIAARPQHATARVQGTTPYVVFQATATAGEADTIEVTKIEAPYQIPLGTSVIVHVQVRDALGNGVPGLAVDWTSDCGGPMTPAASLTDSAGRASTSWLIQDACTEYRGRATVAGLPDARFELYNVTTGTTYSVEIGPDRTVDAAQDTVHFRPRVYDQYGNLVAPYEGCRYRCYEFVWTSSDTTVAAPLDGYSDVVDTDVGEKLFTIGNAGTATIVARAVNGDYADTMVLTVTAGSAASAARAPADALRPTRGAARPSGTPRRERPRPSRGGR